MSQAEFIQSILKNLEANGFPSKKVALPFEKLYEAADNRGLNFNKVREELRSLHNIETTTDGARIIFSNVEQVSNNFGAMPDLERLKNLSPQEQQAEVQRMLASMDPAQLAQIQKMFEAISPQEKEEIMKRGRDMGII